VKHTTKNLDIVTESVRLSCRALKMPGLLRHLDDLTRRAAADAMSPIEILDDALATEIASREASSVRLRVREARFPEMQTLDKFDFALALASIKRRSSPLRRGRSSPRSKTSSSWDQWAPARRTWQRRSASRWRGSVDA